MPLTLQDLRERAQPWIQPISSEAPAGKAAKLEPIYESIVKEVGKLESPSGGAVNWARVVETGGELLKRSSKDLLIASYVAFGLYATRGLNGLLEGLSALAELMESYWSTLFPEVNRLRARSNALGWFLQRTAIALSQANADDADLVNGLELAAQRLSDVSRDKFATHGPAFGPLLQSLERLRMSLPQASAAGDSTTGAAPEKATATGGPAVAAASPATLIDPANMLDFLRTIGDSLVSAAGVVRRTNPADPLSYRILRTGLWLHIHQLPGGTNGRSPMPALPASQRAQLEKMASNAKWEPLLEESESALVMHRFNLDLQRLSAHALQALGPPFQPARQALLGEVAAWLRRMPSAPQLLSSDGTPLANAQTQEWLKLEVQTTGSAGGSGASPGRTSDESAALLDEARELVGRGKLSEGIRLLQERIQSIEPGRPRFRARLALAKLCAAGGQTAVAKVLYAILDQDCVQHGLDSWEPALAAECLEGLLLTVKALRPGALLPAEFSSHYQRLCGLSLSAALRIEA